MPDILCTPHTQNKGTFSPAFESAKKEQRHWARKSIAERISFLQTFNQFLERDQERLAKLLMHEMGKPLTQAMNEIQGARGKIQYFIDHSERYLTTEVMHVEGGTKEVLTYEPLGLILHISAWNYPYLVAMNVIPSALIAGNAVWYKPSEIVPETGRAITQLLWEAGIPENLVQVFEGDGSLGAELLRYSIDGVFFTGSHATGVKIAHEMSGRLVPLGLELGGKDPLYVTDACRDPDAVAASVVDGVFYNNGQSCCAVERVYVHENIYSSFIEKFVEHTRRLKSGELENPETYLGFLARPEHREFLNRQINDALGKGARLLLGGVVEAEERFFPPTVLGDVNHEMTLMHEESFGPIIGIQKVASDDEALRLMNDTPFGLTASVFCDEEKRAREILDQLDVGTAYWNCCDRVSPYLPWSGRRGSGLGSTLSYLGMRAFVQPKAYHLRARDL